MAKITKKSEASESPVDVKAALVSFIKSQAPTLFDRHPEVTGNVSEFADKIINILNS